MKKNCIFAPQTKNDATMSQKNKLFKFAQNETFPHLFQPKLMYGTPDEFELKGKWNSNFFHNDNPITVELGCGKGEYSVAMAKEIPTGNFIGVDIKGARMWRGASDSLEMEMKNIAFLRTRVEFTPKCFGKDEVSEIWITFPDPQLGPKSKHKKRLTSSRFLSYYQNFLIDNGIVNLKTDDGTLYEYTKGIIAHNGLPLLIDTPNLYESEHYTGFLTLKTHYEKMWNKENRTIKYLRFRLPQNVKLEEMEE